MRRRGRLGGAGRRTLGELHAYVTPAGGRAGGGAARGVDARSQSQPWTSSGGLTTTGSPQPAAPAGPLWKTVGLGASTATTITSLGHAASSPRAAATAAHCRRGAAAGARGRETVRTQAPHNTQGRVHRLSTSVPDLNRAIHNGARAACPQPWSTECSGHQSITQKSFQTTLETCLQDPQGTFVQFSPWLEIAGRLYRNNLTTATLPADSRRGRVYTATRISAPTPILYISP